MKMNVQHSKDTRATHVYKEIVRGRGGGGGGGGGEITRGDNERELGEGERQRFSSD